MGCKRTDSDTQEEEKGSHEKEKEFNRKLMTVKAVGNRKKA